MNKNYLIAYNVALFRDYLLDMHFLTDTIEDIYRQVDEHFMNCCRLVHESLIKNREKNPYTVKVYELLPFYEGVEARGQLLSE